MREEIRDTSGNPLKDMLSAAESLDEKVPAEQREDSNGQYPWWIVVATKDGINLASNLEAPHMWLIKAIIGTGGKAVAFQTLAYILSVLPDEGLEQVEKTVQRMRNTP